MSKSQRTKGATYEREVCAILAKALGREVKRNIGQARDGGNDIDVGPLVIECKRRKTLTTFLGWFEQARAAVTKRKMVARLGNTPARALIPAVIFRADGDTTSYITLELPEFLRLTADRLTDDFVGAVPA